MARGTRLRQSLANADPVALRTADGIAIAASHLAADDGGKRVGVMLAHGFSGHHRKPAQAFIARRLARYAGVLAVDLRGHGASGGLSTMGDLEVLDVDAGVRWLRDHGYALVVTCGWSMGGSVVVRHAALFHDGPGAPDAVVAVSSVSRWYVRDTAPMRRLHWLVERPLGRAVSRRMLRTRLVEGWDVVPESPVELAARIAPTPLLVVHGDRDAYYGLEHARALVTAAGPTAELWVVVGFGHAEGAAVLMPEVVERIGSYVARVGAR
ncbi:MAG: alpha/beta hydrolase [Mycobacteriales bacterium]|nr:alpha/beta fold hydrolase [Frankia sp.]MCA1833603.1 alpha/beta fold hydrolase [Actinomycetota bacterium]